RHDLAHAHEGPGCDLGVELADLALALGDGEAAHVAVGDLLVVAAHRAGVDELRLAAEAVELWAVGGELEERAETGPLDLGAAAGHRPGLGHRPADAVVEVLDHFAEQLELALEVEVERAERDPGTLGDLHDRGVVVSEFGEHLRGGVDDALPGLATL